jgi:hypothetical protein
MPVTAAVRYASPIDRCMARSPLASPAFPLNSHVLRKFRVPLAKSTRSSSDRPALPIVKGAAFALILKIADYVSVTRIITIIEPFPEL